MVSEEYLSSLSCNKHQDPPVRRHTAFDGIPIGNAGLTLDFDGKESIRCDPVVIVTDRENHAFASLVDVVE